MLDITKVLAVAARDFKLQWDGVHGPLHWGRVIENGIRLAESNGANIEVVMLFGALHDAKRENEGLDPTHGLRAAQCVRSLQNKLITLPTELLELLESACRDHSRGLLDGDITVQTCWDADRLDLARFGIQPDVDRLCTAAAKKADVIEWAIERAQNGRVPDVVKSILERPGGSTQSS